MKRLLKLLLWIFIFCQIIFAPSHGISFAFKDIAASLNKSSKLTTDESLSVSECPAKATNDCECKQAAPTSNEVDNEPLNEVPPTSNNFQFSSTTSVSKTTPEMNRASTLFQAKSTFEQPTAKLETNLFTNGKNFGLPISSRINTNQVSSQLKLLPEVAPSLVIPNSSPSQPKTPFGLNLQRSNANMGVPSKLNTAIISRDSTRTLSKNAQNGAASAYRPTTNNIGKQCSEKLLPRNAGTFQSIEQNVAPKNVAQSLAFSQPTISSNMNLQAAQGNKIIQSPSILNEFSKNTQPSVPYYGAPSLISTVEPKTTNSNNNLDQNTFIRNTSTTKKCQVSPISVQKLQNNNKAFSVAQNPRVMSPRPLPNKQPIFSAVKDHPSNSNNPQLPITTLSQATPCTSSNNLLSPQTSQSFPSPNTFTPSSGIANQNIFNQNNNLPVRDISCKTNIPEKNQNNIESYGSNISGIELSSVNKFGNTNVYQSPNMTPLATSSNSGAVPSQNIGPSISSPEILSCPGGISSVFPNTQPTIQNQNVSPQMQQPVIPTNSPTTALPSINAYGSTTSNNIDSFQPQALQTFMPLHTAIGNLETPSSFLSPTISSSGNLMQSQSQQTVILPNLASPSVGVNVPKASSCLNSFQPQVQQSLATTSPGPSAGVFVPSRSSSVTSFQPLTQKPLIPSNTATITPISSIRAPVTTCTGTIQTQKQQPITPLITATSGIIPAGLLPTPTTSNNPILPQISTITINIQPTSESVPTNIMIPGYDITQLPCSPIVSYTNVNVPTLPPVVPSPIVTPPVVTKKSSRRSKKLKRLLEMVLLSQLMGDRRSINSDTLGSVLSLLYT